MTIQLPAPAPGLTLWLIDLDDAAIETSLLDARERLRMSRFHFERDARRFARGRSALRRLLGAHAGVRPEAIRFREGTNGKPHLDLDGHELPFSISHSQARAIVAIGERLPIGVDLEAIRGDDAASLEGLARSVMCDRELQSWLCLAEEGRRQAFYALWSAKEACLKALGCGLRVEPRCVDTGWAQEPRDVSMPIEATHASVRVFPLSPVDGCAAAIAVLHGDSAHLAS